MLYPVELWLLTPIATRRAGGEELVQPGGVEPPTYRSVVCRSIQLSYGCTALPDAEDYRIGGGGGNRAPVPQRTPNG